MAWQGIVTLGNPMLLREAQKRVRLNPPQFVTEYNRTVTEVWIFKAVNVVKLLILLVTPTRIELVFQP